MKPTQAGYTLRDPHEVLAFLQRLVAWGRSPANGWHAQPACIGWALNLDPLPPAPCQERSPPHLANGGGGGLANGSCAPDSNGAGGGRKRNTDDFTGVPDRALLRNPQCSCWLFSSLVLGGPDICEWCSRREGL